MGPKTQGTLRTKMGQNGIFGKTFFGVLAIKWARRGVKAIVGCLNNSGFIIKTMVNIRIDFGRIFHFSIFPIQI